MSQCVICLTGGIGSGKSVVGSLFARLGIADVDTDRIARRLTERGGAAIPLLVNAFGTGILDAEGAMDRSRMRQRAFSDPAVRASLERILHPMIRAQAADACRLAESPYVLLQVPLLAENFVSGGYRQVCRRVLVVDCDERQQLARTMGRGGLSGQEVGAMMAAQASRQARLAIADDVIVNDGTLSDLEGRVLALHQQYLMFAGNS